jgi:hypothetical protein
VRDDGIEVLRCEKRRELETVGQRRSRRLTSLQ